MPDFANRSGRFVVSAKRRDGFIQQTRTKAASAIVLAQSWRDAGHVEVKVIDPAGRIMTPEDYRIQASLSRKRAR